ncbi:MAG: GTPase Era [Spirochaetales bacterium]|nr:GTPase Era [Spirochaetales bacterium]
MKSAFVAIVGRPSAGKSTLLNALCGEKVSITSPVPQTTRNKVRGILNEEEGQLVFIDTPGYHNSERKFNQHLTDIVYSALEESEVLLYVVDATRPLGKEEEEIIALLHKEKKPVVLALNKCDSPNEHRNELRAFLRLNANLERVYEISATEKTGLEELKKALLDASPEGPAMYPEGYYTDQTPEFRIAEVIREKAIARTSEEIPHCLYVEMSDMEWRNDGKELWVRAFLTVERESQKGIVIGKGGQVIKAIRIDALKELKKLFDYKISLDLRVKVNPKWRKKDYLIKGMFT